MIAASRGHDWAFEFRPCLSDAEVSFWEAEHDAELPHEYRRFVREIGDGGIMPGAYTDFEMFPLSEVWGPSVASDFPATSEQVQAWIAATHEERAEMLTGIGPNGRLFAELEFGYDEETDARLIPPGAVRLGSYPGDDDIFLVVQGTLRGSIWSAGRPETNEGCCMSFLEWFADVLAEFEGGA